MNVFQGEGGCEVWYELFYCKKVHSVKMYIVGGYREGDFDF